MQDAHQRRAMQKRLERTYSFTAMRTFIPRVESGQSDSHFDLTVVLLLPL